MLSATLFSDPACPWGYSENPALRVIEWRYGDQLDWKLVLVGLSEDVSRYVAAGFTPLRQALGQVRFRERYGMPFAGVVKLGMSPSSRACRAVIAARREFPGSEWRVFRALQLANFNSPLQFDDDEHVRQVLSAVPGVDAAQIVALIDAPEVLEEYERDKALTRTAAGSPTELQGKAGNSDGAVRYTAPSVIFEDESGRRLEAGGFQPVEAYDVLVANLDPHLERRGAPEDPAELLDFFEFGLATQEVAALMASGNDRPDRDAAETALLALVADGRAERHPLGGDALWTRPGQAPGLGLVTQSLSAAA
ncbi:MAG TPA: DsbA family protein [Solirubrobacteraceae bacterium]|jgi:2-hydroxychromene-2-carboxylate isomerase|nr:DsbA family protein [Solirubrobacteraceae bacterium]